jgi:cell division septation protein DedD
MSDEAFHEIQLNGKQLVFLFMAATVVSVVIFLCGVMVGRGVRAQAATDSTNVDSTMIAADEPARAERAPADPAPAPAPAAGGPQAAAPPDPPETGSGYFNDLTKGEGAKPAAVAPRQEPKAAAPERPAPPPPAETVEQPAAAAAAPPAAVTSGGFAVQIAALRDRSEADAIVKRLAGKGYQAFVVNPVPGKPPVYRVQVGRFADRGEAEKIAARLRSEEQFSPWVTR